MEEIWKPVPSLPGVQASSLGRLLYPEREAPMPNGGVRRYIPNPTLGAVTCANTGAMHKYRNSYNKFYGNIKVHRAVCEAFHGPPPFLRAVVIHIDEDGLNNQPENLKWGTQKENLNMPKIKAYHRSRVGKNSPWAKRNARKMNAE
jgi:hypothetical protein